MQPQADRGKLRMLARESRDVENPSSAPQTLKGNGESAPERRGFGGPDVGQLHFLPGQQGVASGFAPGTPRALIGFGSQSARFGTESSRAPC